MSMINTLGMGINNSFSFDEVDTGFTWVDGRPIYQKSFQWDNPATIVCNSWYTLGEENALGSNCDGIIKGELTVRRSTSVSQNTMQYIQMCFFSCSNNNRVTFYIVYVSANLANSTKNSGIVTVWYLKK